MTSQRTDLHLTWVGARDTCVSRNMVMVNKSKNIAYKTNQSGKGNYMLGMMASTLENVNEGLINVQKLF